ncbi:MAG: hypothetical protein ACPG31_08885 [Planctomycetota bacterium]
MLRLPLALLTAALFAPTAAAQWTDDAAVNTTVVTRSGDQALPKSDATSDGGRWVAWFDNASGNYDVYAQRFDSKGHAMFPAGGLLISDHAQSSSLVDWDLMVDTADNAVITFTDTRNGGDLDVVIYRIAPDGTFLWGADGIVVSFNNDFEADPMVTQASGGDIVVVWSNFGANPGIRMQRFDSNGTNNLALGGATVISEAGAAPGFARIVPGINDEVLVSWIRDTGFFTSIKHLRAMAFTSAGAPSWPAPVEVHDAYNLSFAYSPQLVSDTLGGAVLCWHGSNPSRGNLFDAHVQRIDGNGNELLASGGVQLSSAVGMSHLDPKACFNPLTGKIIAFWSEKNAGQSQSGWFAQQVAANGNLDWGANGKQLLPVDSATKFLSEVEPLGAGALGVLGWSPTGSFGADELIATRLDNNGNQVWGAPVALATDPNSKSTRLSLTMGGSGEAVVFWEDDRNGDDDVFGQKIAPNAVLGARYLAVDVDSVSLSNGGTATLSLDAGERFGGSSYWMLGSNTGTAPGQSGFGITLPLNNGPFFQFTNANPTFSLFIDFRSTLDADGRAEAQVSFPAGFNPGLAGEMLDHAFVVLGSGPIDLVSEAVRFNLVP